MFEEFCTIDRTAHGRRSERVIMPKDWYDLEDVESLHGLLDQLSQVVKECGLLQVNAYDRFTRAFTDYASGVRGEPCILSIFRARVRRPQSLELQSAYAAVGGLQGLVRRQDRGCSFLEFDENTRHKMSVIRKMELAEVDSLGVNITLVPSPYIEVFRAFLNEWGMDKPCSVPRTPNAVFTVSVPYQKAGFESLCVPADQLNVN